jgi:hypothetical protein
MIFIILTWLYIFVISLIYGISFIKTTSSFFKISIPYTIHPAIICIIGLFSLGCLSEVLTFFLPLNLWANVIVLLIGIGSGIVLRKSLVDYLQEQLKILKIQNILIVILFFLSLFAICVLSEGYTTHYDDGLYYSTFIKWTQEYKVVPGLAVLHPRLGFNSLWHVLQALFGFEFLKAGLFNDLNGLLYLLGWSYSLSGILALLKGDNKMSTWLKAFYYIPILALHFGASSQFLLVNINFISCPTADIPAMILCWIVFILFLEKAENKQGEQFDIQTILIIILAVFLVNIKLSAIPVVMLVIFLVFRELLSKKFIIFFQITGLGMILLLPWLLRNVILSGYLLFPFSALDILSVDWKVPMKDVMWHEKAVKVWAINPGANFEELAKAPVQEWFANWYENLSFIHVVILQIIFVATLLFLLYSISQIIRYRASFFNNNSYSIILFITCLSGIFLWLNKAPDFRFGYGFTAFYCIWSIVIFLRYFLENWSQQTAWILICFVLYVQLYYYRDIYQPFVQHFFEKPVAIPVATQVKKQPLSDGNYIIIPTDGESCYCSDLPCAPQAEFNARKFVWRGKTLQDGFKMEKVKR